MDRQKMMRADLILQNIWFVLVGVKMNVRIYLVSIVRTCSGRSCCSGSSVVVVWTRAVLISICWRGWGRWIAAKCCCAIDRRRKCKSLRNVPFPSTEMPKTWTSNQSVANRLKGIVAGTDKMKRHTKVNRRERITPTD